MAVLALVGGTACRSKPVGDSVSRAREAGVIATAAPKLNRLTRSEFNFSAVVLDEPLFWRGDANGDGALDPEELVVTWRAGKRRRSDFVGGDGAFTPTLIALYEAMQRPATPAGLAPDEKLRREDASRSISTGGTAPCRS